MAVTDDSTTTNDTAGGEHLEQTDPPVEGVVEVDEDEEEKPLTVEQREAWEIPEGAVILGPGIWAMEGGLTAIPERVMVDEAGTPPSAEVYAAEVTPTMGVFVDADVASDLVTDDEGNLVSPTATPEEASEEASEAEADTTTSEAEAGETDISNMTVAEVKEYVEANPDQAAAVHDAEMSGKQRATLLDWLETNYTV